MQVISQWSVTKCETIIADKDLVYMVERTGSKSEAHPSLMVLEPKHILVHRHVVSDWICLNKYNINMYK